MATTTVNLGLSLDGLSNVDTAGKNNGDILVWNSTSNKWEDAPTPAAIPAGTTGQVQFNDGGAFAADSAFHWDNTNKRLGVGATPASTVRLDVRAQGALSTDIAFRVRNSANTMDILNIAGNGDFYFSSMAVTTPIFDFAVNEGGNRRSILRIVSGGTNSLPSRVDIQVPFSGGGIGMNIFNQLTGVDQLYLQMNRNNFCLGANTIATATTDRRVVYINNGVAPSSSVTDGFKLYSADITAGNAAPHFRTENGSIIKLYQQSSAGITTVADLVTILQNTGLLS
jgi:hypothetical protein